MSLFKKSIWVLITVSLIGCGSSSETKVPSAGDPNAPGNTNDPGAPTTGVKDGIPDLTNAAPVQLLDNTTYTALEDLFSTIVYGPLVGDSKLKLTLTYASGKLTGSLLFGFEDGKYWRDMTQNSFDNTGSISATKLDIIFQDDSVVTRVKADRSGNTLSNGKFMYRIRQSSDPLVHYVYPGTIAPGQTRPSADVAACKTLTWQCGGSPCASQNDMVPACQAYLNEGVAGTVQVGTFDSTVSAWVK